MAHSGPQERPSIPTERAERLAAYREDVAQRLAWHKSRVDQGLDPRCGLRLMVPGGASVVPNVPCGSAQPFAQFSLDSRDAEFYAVAQAAARELVAYSSPSGSSS